jgi:hypothetical protein
MWLCGEFTTDVHVTLFAKVPCLLVLVVVAVVVAGCLAGQMVAIVVCSAADPTPTTACCLKSLSALLAAPLQWLTLWRMQRCRTMGVQFCKDSAAQPLVGQR